MSRDSLERHQVWCYLGAVLVGLMAGTAWPGLGSTTEALVWPVLAVLLYATFTQVPLVTIPAAFADGRFLATALVGNFVLVPLAVWGLVQLVPGDDVLRLGLLLVLLVPCTDWFITFTQLGRGDTPRAIALTPITLIVQLLLLPLYLWAMSGVDVGLVFSLGDLWPALLVVLGPLVLAAVTELWARSSGRGDRVVAHLGWWPVPMLAVVILLVATAHVGEVRESLHVLPVVAAVSVAHSMCRASWPASVMSVRPFHCAADPGKRNGRPLALHSEAYNASVVPCSSHCPPPRRSPCAGDARSSGSRRARPRRRPRLPARSRNSPPRAAAAFRGTASAAARPARRPRTARGNA